MTRVDCANKVTFLTFFNLPLKVIFFMLLCLLASCVIHFVTFLLFYGLATNSSLIHVWQHR